VTENPSLSSDLSRVIIFGGAGFIGRHLTAFLNSKYEVREIILADIAPPKWTMPENTAFRQCDVREPISESIGGADLIINLAAVHRTPGHPDREYHETNEGGAESILGYATRTGTNRIWFTSSIAVYGPDEEAKTESSEPRPKSAYGKSKLAAEELHRAWAEIDGNTLVIARPATVFGPGEGGNFTRLAKAMRRRAFFYPGRKDTLKACGYVEDLGPAFAFMDQFATPISLFNFAYPEPPTIEEVCLAFVDAAGFAPPKVSVPARVLLPAGSALNAVGVSAFNPARIEKLMVSTNIQGTALEEEGFKFEFGLESAIRRWHEISGDGFS
jgi:nucleoside-diphosphate-sugar epimerase